jgi:hypothetical protein
MSRPGGSIARDNLKEDHCSHPLDKRTVGIAERLADHAGADEVLAGLPAYGQGNPAVAKAGPADFKPFDFKTQSI